MRCPGVGKPKSASNRLGSDSDMHGEGSFSLSCQEQISSTEITLGFDTQCHGQTQLWSHLSANFNYAFFSLLDNLFSFPFPFSLCFSCFSLCYTCSDILNFIFKSSSVFSFVAFILFCYIYLCNKHR